MVIDQNKLGYSQRRTDRILKVFDSGFVVVMLGGRRGLHWIYGLTGTSEQIVGEPRHYRPLRVRESDRKALKTRLHELEMR